MRLHLNIKNSLLLISVIYTLLTIISSIWSLAAGQGTDTHVHLLFRFIITSIGVGSVLLFQLLPHWRLSWVLLIHYSITMGVVLLFVWVNSLFIPLHPHAYRDIFLNFTSIYLLLAICFQVVSRIRSKRG